MYPQLKNMHMSKMPAFNVPPLISSFTHNAVQSRFAANRVLNISTCRKISVNNRANPSQIQSSGVQEVASDPNRERSKSLFSTKGDTFRAAGGLEEGQFAKFWRNYERGNQARAAAELRQGILNTLSAVMSSPEAALYWSFTLGKILFFNTLHTSTTAVLDVRKYFNNSKLPASNTTLLWTAMVWSACNQDLSRIQAGLYKMPWDYNWRHPQYKPTFITNTMMKLVVEMRAMAGRLQDGATEPVWLKGEMYPQYYDLPYHFQTDGWLSSGSADVYDMATEFVFYGGQDAMQRLTLIPMSRYFRGVHMRHGARLKVVELAAGTGRFSTFVRDNWPGISLTVSDLSPFYLQKAREAMRAWENASKVPAHRLGPVAYLQSNAECLPMETNSVDVVYSVYLFHELPAHARRKIVKEVARVLKDGGLFVITDSIQIGDSMTDKKSLERFTEFGEPWYTSYVNDNLVDVACEGGQFRPWMEEICVVTKMVAFRKL